MDRQVAASPEAARLTYERLLTRSLELHARYNELGQRIATLYADHEEGEAEQLSHERHEIEGPLGELMKERVELLRDAESLTVLEDVFPRVRPEALKEHDAAAIDRALAPGGTRRARRHALHVQNPSDELNDDEREAFNVARVALARRYGFKPVNDDDSDWFTITKNGIEFELNHLAFPNAGIMGASRIAKLSARRTKRPPKLLLNFDGGWDTACADPDAQKEIDRVVALFA
jgi:hypothetical protein